MWQPIETAPKDGTRVLLYEPRDDEHMIEVGFWDYDSWYGPVHVYTIWPTHWQPLPTPPATSMAEVNQRVVNAAPKEIAAYIKAKNGYLNRAGGHDDVEAN